MKRLKTAGLLCAALFLFVMSGTAQTKDDVIKAYTDGAAAIKANEFAKAVDLFQQVIDLGTKVGVESDTLRKVAELNIAKIQLALARELYQNKATANADILAAFQKTKVLADKYGDTDTSEKVTGILPRIYTKMAGAAFNASDFPSALANFDKVISFEPGNIQAYFNKGIIYKKQNAFDPMVQSLTKAIELATKDGDTVTIKKSKIILGTEYMNLANAAYVKKDFKGTLAPLESALKYDDKNPQAYYILAVTKNGMKEYDAALEAVTKGLQFEDPALKEKIARLYYEQGVAYKAKGDKEKAIAAFKLASFGKYVIPAAAQIKDITKPPVAPVKK